MAQVNIHNEITDQAIAVSACKFSWFATITLKAEGDEVNLFFKDMHEMRQFSLAVVKAATEPNTAHADEPREVATSTCR